MNPNDRIRIVEPLLIFIAIGVGIFYLINVLNTGNWFWFRGTATNVRPARIVIIDRGQRTTLSQGHEDFALLANAVERSLGKLANTDLIGIGLSQQTLADYESDSLIVELYFDEPVQFNTQARTGEPTQLLIPIVGRHADGRYVFLGANGKWQYGAVRMADPTPLYQALETMGYETAVSRQATHVGQSAP